MAYCSFILEHRRSSCCETTSKAATVQDEISTSLDTVDCVSDLSVQ